MAFIGKDRLKNRHFRISHSPFADFLRRFFLREEGRCLASAPPPAPAAAAVPRPMPLAFTAPGSAEGALEGAFLTGIEPIDHQHQSLVNAIRKLQASLKRGHHGAVEEEIVDFLLRYGKDHFILEEAYMERLAYPELESHRSEHLHFFQQIQSMKARIQSGEDDLALELSRVLFAWLRNHILKEDSAYVEFARNRSDRRAG